MKLTVSTGAAFYCALSTNAFRLFSVRFLARLRTKVAHDEWILKCAGIFGLAKTHSIDTGYILVSVGINGASMCVCVIKRQVGGRSMG